ncbi:DUF4112 domain-containing protein (plasmid) [Acuticoccus sp. MNP-M23]|uniref:DUF4112 domain-containing protein n=1 Tax=Acuticoccus sp. MNP-M23 TaxID=3072793 RepID=UPI002816044A|nr:DUF4112 domain-containing protein [Acuticoccus sp. MNP-M23]WMS45337.1 DUF4112 domain-containing protein [Acuticoccus sp. MNP-M23]
MNNVERLPTPHHHVQPALYEPEPVHHTIPPHILAEIAKLTDTHEDVERFAHQADGLVGPIGLDGILTMVPGLGGLYSAYGGFKLLGCASRARCSGRTRIAGFVLTIVDVVIGVFVGVGDLIDVFLRSHRIYAGMIQDEIRGKLIAYQTIRDHGERRGHITQGEVIYLENALFRGGRSAGTINLRNIALIGFALIILYALFA